MYNRLLKFIDKNNLFNDFQFGFRNNHSTFMALIVLVENLVTALDNGNCAVGLFLDFQKAFDTVDHCILLDNFMVSVALLMTGFIVISQIAHNQWITMTMNLISKWWNVVFHKALSWTHYYFWSISMTCLLFPSILCQFFLQMTQIFSVLDPIFMILFAR